MDEFKDQKLLNITFCKSVQQYRLVQTIVHIES